MGNEPGVLYHSCEGSSVLPAGVLRVRRKVAVTAVLEDRSPMSELFSFSNLLYSTNFSRRWFSLSCPVGWPTGARVTYSLRLSRTIHSDEHL